MKILSVFSLKIERLQWIAGLASNSNNTFALNRESETSSD